MLKKIIGTAGARVFNAFLSFVIVIVYARNLGAEGAGIIAEIVLGITIVLLISNFFGGGALVYLLPRHDNFIIFLLSYIWAIISAFVVTYFLNLFNAVPAKFIYDVLLLSIIQSFSAVNQNILLSKEKIKLYNSISVLQFSGLFAALMFFIFVLKKVEVSSYVNALYVGYSVGFVLSFVSILKYLKFKGFNDLGNIIKQLLKYGSYVQFANILQFLNYRLSYYIITSYFNKAMLGVYSVGNKLSEGTWLVGKSVSMVQYSRIANSKDKEYNKYLTLAFLKFTFVITLILVAILLLIPENVFVFVFHKEFSNIKIVISSLSVGIVAMSMSMMFSHYFSGTGRHYYNTISSGIGLIITFALGFTLIPRYNILGAGITASVSYFTSCLFQLIVFVKLTKSRFNDFLIKKTDVKLFFQEVGRILKKDDKNK